MTPLPFTFSMKTLDLSVAASHGILQAPGPAERPKTTTARQLHRHTLGRWLDEQKFIATSIDVECPPRVLLGATTRASTRALGVPLAPSQAARRSPPSPAIRTNLEFESASEDGYVRLPTEVYFRASKRRLVMFCRFCPASRAVIDYRFAFEQAI